MTVQDLTEKYGLSEAELYVYAFNHLKSFKKRESKETTWKFSGSALRQLDWLLRKERNENSQSVSPDLDDDWLQDPTEDEPDDSEVPPPQTEPELEQERKPEATVAKAETENNEKSHATPEKEAAWEAEKLQMNARLEVLQQELAALRHTHLTMQSSAAEQQAELLAKAIHEKQLAESRIAVMKEDAASVKHLSNVRIKELEERNADLETQLKEAHAELESVSEELQSAQNVIQDIKSNANKQGAQQKLQLLDAQHRQDELYKAIHDKEIALTEEKEKSQDLLEKYNGALLRIGEIVGKIEKARAKMMEVSAEFDAYIQAERPEEAGGTAAEAQAPATGAAEEKAPEPVAATPMPTEAKSPAPVPNPESVQVFGTPIHEIYPETGQKEQAASKPSFWRKIASFF